jgi:hypothetical protein
MLTTAEDKIAYLSGENDAIAPLRNICHIVGEKQRNRKINLVEDVDSK